MFSFHIHLLLHLACVHKSVAADTALTLMLMQTRLQFVPCEYAKLLFKGESHTLTGHFAYYDWSIEWYIWLKPWYWPGAVTVWCSCGCDPSLPVGGLVTKSAGLNGVLPWEPVRRCVRTANKYHNVFIICAICRNLLNTTDQLKWLKLMEFRRGDKSLC